MVDFHFHSIIFSLMMINSDEILPLLNELLSLTKAQQNIFLYCLKKCPRPRPYTGDLFQISNATKSCRNTVHDALVLINKKKYLSKIVRYVRINTKEQIFYDSIETQNLLSEYGEDID